MAVVQKRNERKSPEKTNPSSEQVLWRRRQKYNSVPERKGPQVWDSWQSPGPWVGGVGGSKKKEKRRDQAHANTLLTKSRQPQSRGATAPPAPPATTWSNWVAEIYDDAELLISHSANPHKCHRQRSPCHRVKTSSLALWALLCERLCLKKSREYCNSVKKRSFS